MKFEPEYNGENKCTLRERSGDCVMGANESASKWAAPNFIDSSSNFDLNLSPALSCSPAIQLTAEDLYDKEKVDLETIVVDDVFKLLQYTEEGLSAEEAIRRLELFGPYKLEEQNAFLQDFVGIILLLFINSFIGFYEERNAGNTVKALIDSLAPKAEGQARRKMAALTGESLPQNKKLGDQCFSGFTCKQGEPEGVVISTGPNTFFGRAALLVGQDDDTTGHLQKILAQIGSFCLVAIGIFVLAEIFCLYAGFCYQYRRGLDNILVLLIGGIPIAMPTVLSVTLAVGVQQLANYKAIVTRITAIEELAAVTILCSDETGTLTTNKLTIDRSIIRTYGAFSGEDVTAIDSCVVGAIGDPTRARAGIKLLDFKPFNPVDKRTEITYREESFGQLKRVTKELEGEDLEDEGNSFELIGLLAIFDPPREDTKQTIDDVIALGVKVKMVTGDQLAIAKETGRRLGLGDHMYPTKVLKDGPAPGGKHATSDEVILDADGFAGVFPEHKYEIVKRLQGLGHLYAMTGDGANDAPALSPANVGIAVEGATDAARGATDIVLTEPGLSTIVHAIRGSCIIFQRMRNYSIYACAVTIRIVVCFAILAFAYKFEFLPFMVLIIALLNDGTIMTLSVDRVLPSSTPDSWDLQEIFAYAVVYGIYLTASTFGVTLENGATSAAGNHNDRQLHMIVYLQVAIISQALIFVTRSHSFYISVFFHLHLLKIPTFF
ncbi:hypothetical protein EUX98_g8705 [Antrodiella citrinella]|uniref:P-type ATPase A domain-containing protein n=1 Tax=Antrodiella citrinella TaxID=2447956 RepID=A0A4S4M598_9APHY|nr:hypothetical protein EUX98_g8705 [Antrodiella citrinella]